MSCVPQLVHMQVLDSSPPPWHAHWLVHQCIRVCSRVQPGRGTRSARLLARAPLGLGLPTPAGDADCRVARTSARP